MSQQRNIINSKVAMNFIILFGIISMFADMTYEAARSITGPYLAVLGASGAIVGIVAGFGEFLGYGLRLVSGYIADQSKRYWTIVLCGYFINLLAVPTLALAGSWQIAAVLIILERTGKAIRVPARDAMLSHASHVIGVGKGFGIHEALDQLGALLGPIIIATALFFHGGYRESFAILLIPACIALFILFIARRLYPDPKNLEIIQNKISTENMKTTFWLYLTASTLIAAGYVDYPLIAYHFEKSAIISSIWIPIFYSVSMGASALAAYLFGNCYDRFGFKIVIIATLISAFFAPFVFLGNYILAFIGMILWGIGMGGQNSLIKAIVANIVVKNKRASAYGIFNAAFGISWFIGSSIMGVLYDYSLIALILFSILLQLFSIPLFYLIQKKYLITKS